MYNIRKVVNILVAAALSCILLLTGCGANTGGSGTETGKTDPSTAGTVQTVQKEELKPVELTWYTIAKEQRDTELVEQEVQKYLKDSLNVTVRLKFIDWGAYEQKMNVMIASGDEFDLAFAASWMLNFSQNAAKGAWYPIGDLVDQYGPHLKQMYEKYLPAATVNGKLYGIPHNAQPNVGGIFVRKDLADKYHLDINTVKKPEDLETFFDQIVKNENGITPLCMTQTNVGTFPYIFDTPAGEQVEVGVKRDDTSLKVVVTPFTDESRQIYDLMRSWNQKGYIRKDAASLKDFDGEMKSKKYAVRIGSYMPGWDTDYGKKWGLEIVSTGYTKPLLTTTGILSGLAVVGANCKNPDRAVMLLDKANSDPVLLNMFSYGIEGRNYVNVDTSNPVHVIKQPDGVTADTNGFWPNSGWMFANPQSMYSENVPLSVKLPLIEENKKIMANADPSVLNGFVFDPTPVKAQVAQVTALYQEYEYSLGCGAVDVDKTLNEYGDKLKKAGVDDIVKEMQNQIDTWKAQK